MLGNLEKSQVTPSNSNSNLDEPTKLAFYLFNCAKTFLSSGSIQVLPAIKCLYMALSMVLAPQIEVELRLMLGNVLLDHTMNYNEALDQIQKAHQLAESSLGAIKFDEKCRITRSLIDALIRTNSLQLVHNILEKISLETLQMKTISAWNWFLHFSLMNIQLKLDNKTLLHQALADTDNLLKIIQNYSESFDSMEWKVLLTCSKVLVLSVLLIILTDDRKILSVFTIIPKAAGELRQALNDLSDINNKDFSFTEMSFGTAFFGESLLLLNSLNFSNSMGISSGISNFLNLFEKQQLKCQNISLLKLPGQLVFLEFDEFKLFGDFIILLTLRQSSGYTFIHLQGEIQRLIRTVDSSRKFSFNYRFLDNLLMVLNSFKSTLDLEAGIITQIVPKNGPIGDSAFNKKFREFLSFTAHQVVARLGIPKVVAFYDHKINSTPEVDLNNLMFLNKALLTSSTIPSESLEAGSHALQILTNSVAFNLIRAIELKRSSAPAHHIRNVLNNAETLLKSQLYHEPKIECIFHLLQGEFILETDYELARNHLQIAFQLAKDQLANKTLMSIAAKQLAKSFKLTGDDEISSQWLQV